MNDYQDFSPPGAPVTDAPDCPLELAERGSRLGAKIVDALTVLGAMLTAGIVAAIGIPILMSIYRTAPGNHTAFTVFGLVAGSFGALALLGLVIWNCVWLQRYGQTVGKRVLHVRIVRSNGERATLGRIFWLRYAPLILLGCIPYLGFLVTLTDYLLIFRDSRQCLHDQFADTKVVKTG